MSFPEVVTGGLSGEKKKVEEEPEQLPAKKPKKHRIPVVRTEQNLEMPADHWRMRDPIF